MQYAGLCSDPLNVFKYMEEKSICIYLGNFWLNQSQVLAEMGDFSNSFLCLKEAISRDHIEKYSVYYAAKMILSLKSTQRTLNSRFCER